MGSTESSFSVRIFPDGHLAKMSVKVPPRSMANWNLFSLDIVMLFCSIKNDLLNSRGVKNRLTKRHGGTTKTAIVKKVNLIIIRSRSCLRIRQL